MLSVPNSLRVWFLIHFAVDLLFGIPLLLAPMWTTKHFGLILAEDVTTRLVGAALIGIGGASLWMHREGREAYRAMLRLKIIWSACAILALLLAPSVGAPDTHWGIILIFTFFFFLWLSYIRKLR